MYVYSCYRHVAKINSRHGLAESRCNANRVASLAEYGLTQLVSLFMRLSTYYRLLFMNRKLTEDVLGWSLFTSSAKDTESHRGEE